jgi:hypothetical protein
MSTSLVLPILAVSLAIADQAAAQRGADVRAPAASEAPAGSGWLSGVVIDEVGAAVGGASILVSGAAVVVALTDTLGRFTVALPVGHYFVEASRPGFVSPHREPVRIDARRRLQRRIPLYRDALATALPEAAQPPAAPSPMLPAEAEDGLHGHSEMTWRLRHLRRTVLRDVQPHVALEDPGSGDVLNEPALRRVSGRGDGTPALIGLTNLSGHVNLLTTGSWRADEVPEAGGWSESVANVFLGAPVGRWGDVSIRGTMSAGDSSAWALRGEYEAPPDRRHEVRLAVTYRTLGFTSATGGSPLAVLESRRSGGFEASDRFHVRPGLTVDYGVRFDHHDELSDPALVSPHAGVQIRVRPGTSVRMSAARLSAAPGIDEVLPPSGFEPWLPAVRTYSLVPDAPLAPERTQRLAVGVDHAVGSSGSSVLSLERFTESTGDQLATLFGLHDGEAGRYYVARAGDVSVAGWRLAVATPLARYVYGRLDYATGRAQWTRVATASPLADLAPHLVRRGVEVISDVRAALKIEVPRTATGLAIVYRVSRLDPPGRASDIDPLMDDGFDLKLRQRLPYRPLDAGLLHLLFTISTLVHDDGSESLYDEVLTVRAPARLTAGLQLGF